MRRFNGWTDVDKLGDDRVRRSKVPPPSYFLAQAGGGGGGGKMLIAGHIKTDPPITHQSHPNLPLPPSTMGGRGRLGWQCNLQICFCQKQCKPFLIIFYNIDSCGSKSINLSITDQGDGERPRWLLQ